MCARVCMYYIHVLYTYTSASALQLAINMARADKDQTQQPKNGQLSPCICSSPGDGHSSFAWSCVQYSRVGTEINSVKFSWHQGGPEKH